MLAMMMMVVISCDGDDSGNDAYHLDKLTLHICVFWWTVERANATILY